MPDERDELLEDIERSLKRRGSYSTPSEQLVAAEANERALAEISALVDLARAHGVIRYPRP